jgi:hypothetical protein
LTKSWHPDFSTVEDIWPDLQIQICRFQDAKPAMSTKVSSTGASVWLNRVRVASSSTSSRL